MNLDKRTAQIHQIIRRLASLEDIVEERRINDLPTHHQHAEIKELRILLRELMNKTLSGGRNE